MLSLSGVRKPNLVQIQSNILVKLITSNNIMRGYLFEFHRFIMGLVRDNYHQGFYLITIRPVTPYYHKILSSLDVKALLRVQIGSLESRLLPQRV